MVPPPTLIEVPYPATWRPARSETLPASVMTKLLALSALLRTSRLVAPGRILALAAAKTRLPAVTVRLPAVMISPPARHSRSSGDGERAGDGECPDDTRGRRPQRGWDADQRPRRGGLVRAAHANRDVVTTEGGLDSIGGIGWREVGVRNQTQLPEA